jgi:predicted Zn-dependent protease
MSRQFHIGSVRAISVVSAGLLLAFVLGATEAISSAQTSRANVMSDSDRSALREALNAYDAGNLSGAEPMLRDLLSRYPTSYEANEALGSLYVESNFPAKALPYLEHARGIAPRQALAHANLGAAYLKLNRPTEAVRELQIAARLDPKNGDTQSALGQAFMAEGNAGEAARAFALASAAKPDDWDLQYNRALALFSSGSVQQAREIARSIPSSSASDQVESLRGDIEEKAGDYKQAVQYYQDAAQKNPSDANIYALTVEFLRHWTWDEAAKVAQFGEKRYPASTHFEVAEGVALYAGNHYPEAAATFSALLAHDPDNPLYSDLLGRSCALMTEGSSAECMGLVEFARRHPENAKASTYAATSLLHRSAEKQDTAQAEVFLRQAIAADPKLADAYFEMGVLQQTRLDYKASTEMLERAVALRPAFPEAHYRLSRAYSHLGMKERAQHEIALQQQYSQQEKNSLDSRMQEVVTFVLKPN